MATSRSAGQKRRRGQDNPGDSQGQAVTWGRQREAMVSGKEGRKEEEWRMIGTSSLSERALGHPQRRLSDWINPEGGKKVHSLINKVVSLTLSLSLLHSLLRVSKFS